MRSTDSRVAARAVCRVCVLGAYSWLCSLGAGVVALWVSGRLLSPTDGVFGLSTLQVLQDPFVLMIWLPLVIAGAVLGFGFSLLTLWNVDLVKAIPTVTAVTIIAAAVTAPLMLLSPLPTFLAGVAAMVWCRWRWSQARPR